jgi:diguanylate cyclase (GGDEF)-like protein/PAS domain S-box-containing protein
MIHTAEILSFSLIFVAAALLSISVYVSIRRRNIRGWLPFSFLMYATALYAGGYAGEILQSTEKGIIFWLHIEYFGIPFIPLLWVIFAYEHSDIRLNRKIFYIPLAAEALITFIAEQTNGIHGLYYQAIEIVKEGTLSVGYFSHGPLYWFHIVVQQSAMIAGALIIIHHTWFSRRLYRIQAVFISAGAMIPILGNIVYLAGASPFNVDISPFTLALSGALCFAGLFLFNILDILPISRMYFFDAIRDAAIVYDVRNRLVDFNKAAARLFPFLSEHSIGLNISSVFSEHREISKLLGKESGLKDFHIGENGIQRCYELLVSPLSRGSSPIGHAVIFSDITERTNLHDEIKRLAEIDPLTGALNRRSFLSRAHNECARSSRMLSPLTVMLLDLDNFKKINDTYGHAAGDEVLKSAVAIFAKTLRSIDIFARYGGEEFAILLPGTSESGAAVAAEKIRRSIESETVIFAGHEIRFTTSIGIVGCIASPRTTIDGLMRLADKAMYRAKESGKNRVEIEYLS